MICYVLKGPGPEMAERLEAVKGAGLSEIVYPDGENTYEEAEHIGVKIGTVTYVVTSAYHVPRAYLTILASLRRRGFGTPVLHVWGTGTVTNAQAQSEAAKLAAAQARGHALRWEDV